MSLLISGATIIDGVARQPVEGHAIWVEDGRIKAIGQRDELGSPPGAQVIDAHGKYVIPGLMDANVHLMAALRMEDLVRHEDRYEDIILEAAQITLKGGVTTVFDTWGPRQALMTVRDQINRGEVQGSRIFCAGNIVGLDGPFSEDFFKKTLEVASPALVQRINSIWAENVGPKLTWMTPAQVAHEVRAYIGKGVDFIKYAASEHRIPMGPNAFLAFSAQSQAAIVEEAHRAGLTAQAHTQSVEALRVAIEAGCDIIQHCNITGPVPIPSTTLQLLVDRRAASTVLPMTKRRYDRIMEKGDALLGALFSTVAVDINVQNLIQSGATLLLATDGGVMAAEAATDPILGRVAKDEDNMFALGEGHIYWFKAMEEKGFPPMEALKAATRNIAVAYKKDKDLGTLEPGKIADMLILEKDPLLSADNYRSVQMVLKDGVVIDTSLLPANPILTRPGECRTATAVLGSRRVQAAGLPACCAGL